MMAEALGRDVCLGGYRLDEVFRLQHPSTWSISLRTEPWTAALTAE